MIPIIEKNIYYLKASGLWCKSNWKYFKQIVVKWMELKQNLWNNILITELQITIYCFFRRVSHRSIGLSLSTTSMRLGKSTAPFVMILLTEATWLPYTIFCVLCFLTIIIATTLPDTSNIDLMTTIEEADRFYTRKATNVYVLNEDLTLK